MMRFDRFTERAQDAAMRAYEILHRYQHTQVDTEHMFLALLEQPGGVIPQLLEQMDVPLESVRARLEGTLSSSPRSAAGYTGAVAQVFITPRLKRVIDVAQEEANKLRDEYISTEHIFLAIASERSTPAARLLEGAGVTRESVYEAVQKIRGGQRATDPQDETRYRTLERFSRDLSQMEREDKLDSVIEHHNEIDSTWEELLEGLKGGQDWSRHFTTIGKLGKAGKDNIQILLKALHHADIFIKHAAILALSSFDDPDILSQLVEIAGEYQGSSHTDILIRSALAKATSRMSLLCGFCRRDSEQVHDMIPGKEVHICNECLRKYEAALDKTVSSEIQSMSEIQSTAIEPFVLYCSFCYRSNDEVDHLFRAGNDDIYICSNCVRECRERLYQQRIQYAKDIAELEESVRQTTESGRPTPEVEHVGMPFAYQSTSEFTDTGVDTDVKERVVSTNIVSNPFAHYLETIMQTYKRWAAADEIYLRADKDPKNFRQDILRESVLPVYIAQLRPSPEDPLQPLDPYQALKDQPRTIILGEISTGKSSICEQLVYRVASRSDSRVIPILVRLRVLQPGQTPLILVHEELKSCGLTELALDQTEQILQKNDQILWIIFDGLDEIPGNSEEQLAARNVLLQFIAAYPHHQYTFTCNIFEYNHPLLRFEQWEILPLIDDTDWDGNGKSFVLDYISSKLHHESTEVIQRIASCGVPIDELDSDETAKQNDVQLATKRFYLHLRRNDILRDWARIPLFLHMLYQTAASLGVVPESSAELYAAYIESLAATAGISSDLRQQIEHFLSLLGRTLCEKGIRSVRQEEWEQIIQRNLEDQKSEAQQVTDAAFEIGLLTDYRAGYLGFTQSVMRDYFAAIGLVRLPDLELIISTLTTDAKWQRPIVQFLQMDTPFRTVKNLQALMTSTADLRVRIEAANVLGKIGDPRFAPPNLTPEWLPVPEGDTILGDDEFDPDRMKHEVKLAAYRIARFPITNAQYLEFVKAADHRPPRHWHRGQYPANSANHPVTYVSWHDARAYCDWLTKVLRESGEIKGDLVVRLPTEAEWERAARGSDERLYPWGDIWNSGLCNSSESGLHSPSPVGIYLGGTSPIGAEEMAGNVFEWTSSAWGLEWSFSDFTFPYSDNDGREDPDIIGYRVLRGGSWYHDQTYAQCTFRHRALPGMSQYAYGFRSVIAHPLPKAVEPEILAEYHLLLRQAESSLCQGRAIDAGEPIDKLWKKGRLDVSGWIAFLIFLERIANYKDLFSVYETYLQGVRESRIVTILAYCYWQVDDRRTALHLASAAKDIAGSLSWPNQTGKMYAECVSENDVTSASLYALLLRYSLPDEDVGWALGWAEPAREARNRPADSYIFLGDLYRSIGKYEDAVTEYTGALELPDDFWRLAAYYGRARSYRDLALQELESDDLLKLQDSAAKLLRPVQQNYHALYYHAFAQVALAQRSIIPWSEAYNAVREALLIPCPRYVSELRVQLNYNQANPSTDTSIQRILAMLEKAEAILKRNASNL